MSFDYAQFARQFTYAFASLTAADTVNAARRHVRVDTGNLRNSISMDEPRYGRFDIYTDEVYAAAQEYGRPDLPGYGFTPYMRPGLQDAIDNAKRNAAQAAKIAARRAR